MSDCFVFANAELLEVGDASSWAATLFPVVGLETPTAPFVQVAKDALNRDDLEVAYPALKALSKLVEPTRDRDAAIAVSDLASLNNRVVPMAFATLD